SKDHCVTGTFTQDAAMARVTSHQGASMVMAETQFSPESRWLSAPARGTFRARQDSAACVSLSSRLTCQRAKVVSATRRYSEASETTTLPPDEDRWETAPVRRKFGALQGSEASVPRDKGLSNGTPCPCQHPNSAPAKKCEAGAHRAKLSWRTSPWGPVLTYI